MFVPCWSLGGGRYRHLTGPAGVCLPLLQIHVACVEMVNIWEKLSSACVEYILFDCNVPPHLFISLDVIVNASGNFVTKYCKRTCISYSNDFIKSLRRKYLLVCFYFLYHILDAQWYNFIMTS
jgi:hypothetical protein